MLVTRVKFAELLMSYEDGTSRSTSFQITLDSQLPDKQISPINQSLWYDEYTPEERAQIGRYGTEMIRPRVLDTSLSF